MLEFPAETRLQIFRYLLVYSTRTYDLRRRRSSGIRLKIVGQDDVEVSNKGFAGLSSQIAQVDRQICAEALPILYGMNVFNMEFSGRQADESDRASHIFLDRIGRRNISLMRHIDSLDYGSIITLILSVQKPQEKSCFGLIFQHHSLANLESIRLLLRDIYDVKGFPSAEEVPENIEDAASEAKYRQLSSTYHRLFLLHTYFKLKDFGLDLKYWYEMKEKYYVEPVFYACRHPLKEHANLLESRDPEKPSFLPLEIDTEQRTVKRMGGPHPKNLGGYYEYETDATKIQ